MEARMTERIPLCPYRDLCLVPCGARGEKLRSELSFPCGFEMAGTVGRCPKARAFDVGAGKLEEG